MTVKELEQLPPTINYWDVRHQLRDHIYARANECFARGDAARDAIKSRAALVKRQKAIRHFIAESLGGLPPRNTPLNARTVGIVEGKGFKIEKVIFESRPGTFVTANLYLSDHRRGPQGAVLFLCGHSQLAKQNDEYQGVCQRFVQAGLIVLAIDPIGQGERYSYQKQDEQNPRVRWGTMEHDYAGAQCAPLGDMIGRYFLHDSMRALDYMRSRPEIDPDKIGVTGNSGGGTQSSLMMLADPRLAAAAPGTFIMNRQTYMYTGGAQDAEQIWPGFTAAGFDHEDILLGMCPKPVRVLAVTYDFFPIEGTRRTVERCKRIWKLFGRQADIDLAEDASVHSYTPGLAHAATEFFCKHLLGRKPARKEWPVSVVEPSRLWCTKSGQVVGEIEGARVVLDENRDRLAAIQARRSRARALSWLRRRVFANRKPCPQNPRFVSDWEVDGIFVEAAFWWSQQGLLNEGLFFRDAARKREPLPVTIAVWDGGWTKLEPHWEWIRGQCRAGRVVMVLETSGVGALTPHPLNWASPNAFYGVIHKLSDDLFWLDDDLAALRTFDVIRAMDLVRECPSLSASDMHLYGHGRQGVYAQLAAAIDRRAKAVEIVGGIGSYADFVRARDYDHHDVKAFVFRGILRHCDLPDLMEWMKERGTIVQ